MRSQEFGDTAFDPQNVWNRNPTQGSFAQKPPFLKALSSWQYSIKSSCESVKHSRCRKKAEIGTSKNKEYVKVNSKVKLP